MARLGCWSHRTSFWFISDADRTGLNLNSPQMLVAQDFSYSPRMLTAQDLILVHLGCWLHKISYCFTSDADCRGVHSVGSVKTEPNYPKPNYHFTFLITEPNYPKTKLIEPNLFRLIRLVDRINRNFQNLIFLIFIY